MAYSEPAEKEWNEKIVPVFHAGVTFLRDENCPRGWRAIALPNVAPRDRLTNEEVYALEVYRLLSEEEIAQRHVGFFDLRYWKRVRTSFVGRYVEVLQSLAKLSENHDADVAWTKIVSDYWTGRDDARKSPHEEGLRPDGFRILTLYFPFRGVPAPDKQMVWVYVFAKATAPEWWKLACDFVCELADAERTTEEKIAKM